MTVSMEEWGSQPKMMQLSIATQMRENHTIHHPKRKLCDFCRTARQKVTNHRIEFNDRLFVVKRSIYIMLFLVNFDGQIFLVNFDGQIFQHQNMRKGQTLIEVLIALENIENVVKLQLSEAQIRLRLSLFDNMGAAPIGDLYLENILFSVF